MARSVLIVEDNEGVAALLGELCTEAGLATTRVRGGSKALEALAGPPPDLVLVDVVLEDLDGFQVANAVRALPGGDRVPLVLVSGVYKKLPDAFVERVAPRFLAKPFDPQQIRDLLQEVFGAQDAAAGLTRGRFTKRMPAQAFFDLCSDRATGVLEVSAADVRRRVWWQAGQVRFAQSNVRAESAGGMQVAQGSLDAAAFDRAVAHAKAARVPLHDALAQSGAMTAAQVTEALRAQTSEVAGQVLGMIGAEWTFTKGDVEKVPDARRPTLSVIVEAGRRLTSVEEARAALEARPDGKVRRTPVLDRELYALRAAAPGEGVTSLLASQPLLSDLVEKVKPDDLVLLLGLVHSGFVTVDAAPSAPTVAAHHAPASEGDEDRGKHFNADEQQARRFIFQERDRAKNLNHYELLGVPPNAPVADCRRSYLDLARRYHSDAYAGLELGSARRLLADLFQHLNEAIETISDEKRRAEYAVFLDRKAKGLPTDVQAILRAEQLFQRGEVLLKVNKAQEALELFREAVTLNHAEPEFHAYLGYALFRVKGAQALDEAKAHVLKALKDAPDLPSAYVLLGLMARDTGKLEEAMGFLQKVLEKDPKHEQANRELRALRLKKDRDGGKGLLGKLFGR